MFLFYNLTVVACEGATDKRFLILLGNRLKQLRKSKGLTQLELAILCQNHAEQIGRIERGQHNVSICSLLAIANALQVPVSEILKFEY
jgi:transcriptional regulator with XRE-family HTH domain